MIRYFVEVQLVFAVLVALQCAFVLALAGIYVSFERWRHRSLLKTCLPDNWEGTDSCFYVHEARLRTLASPSNRFTGGVRDGRV